MTQNSVLLDLTRQDETCMSTPSVQEKEPCVSSVYSLYLLIYLRTYMQLYPDRRQLIAVERSTAKRCLLFSPYGRPPQQNDPLQSKST